MLKSENWAIEIGRLEEFFRSQPDIETTDAGFQYGTCCITLQRLEDRNMGHLHFPQSRITFDGNEEALNQIYHRFFMRFVSAGG